MTGHNTIKTTGTKTNAKEDSQKTTNTIKNQHTTSTKRKMHRTQPHMQLNRPIVLSIRQGNNARQRIGMCSSEPVDLRDRQTNRIKKGRLFICTDIVYVSSKRFKERR